MQLLGGADETESPVSYCHVCVHVRKNRTAEDPVWILG